MVLGRREKSGKEKKLSRPSKVSEKGDCPQGSLTGHVSPAFNFLVGSRIRFVGNFFEVLVLRYLVYHKSCPIHPRLSPGESSSSLSLCGSRPVKINCEREMKRRRMWKVASFVTCFSTGRRDGRGGKGPNGRVHHKWASVHNFKLLAGTAPVWLHS